MRSLTSLAAKLSQDYPEVSFIESDQFLWSPGEKSIHYSSSGTAAQLLHELSHYILGHSNYVRDIQLIVMERSAWDKAKSLAGTYNIEIDDDAVQDYLDTYRDWMHARSTCPACEAIGIQTDGSMYQCPGCRSIWKVNEARICGLKRYIQK